MLMYEEMEKIAYNEAYFGTDEALVEHLDSMLKIKPYDVNTLIKKGDTLFMMRKYPEAIKCFEKALVADPHNAVALNSKGYVLSRLGKFREAVKYFDQALNIKPNKILSLINKGDALCNLYMYDEAIEYYDYALTVDPNDPDALGGKRRTMEKLDDIFNLQNLSVVEELNEAGKNSCAIHNYEASLNYYNKSLTFDQDNIDALKGKILTLERKHLNCDV